ncbi:MAG: response regulator transcription factor [Ferruginibacter sp.]
MREKIIVAIVDDHQIVIDGLVSLLRNNENITLAFVTTDSTTVVHRLSQTPVDILLTDVMMPVLPGNKLAKEIKEKFPAIRILALSMNGDAEVVDEMIQDANIAGYALKNISRDELCKAIEKIAGGGVYFSPEVLEELNKTTYQQKECLQVTLTHREIEIVKLIEKEMSTRQIASSLFISERTVETHRKNIFRKTNVNSLIGLIKYAYLHNLV